MVRGQQAAVVLVQLLPMLPLLSSSLSLSFFTAKHSDDDEIVQKVHEDRYGCHWPARKRMKTWEDAPESELRHFYRNTFEEYAPGPRSDCFAHAPLRPSQTFFAPGSVEEMKLRCDLSTWTDIKDDELSFYYASPCERCSVRSKSKSPSGWFEDCRGACNYTGSLEDFLKGGPGSKKPKEKHKFNVCLQQSPHMRPSFRRRLKILPPVGLPEENSTIKHLERVIGNRQLVWAGDSITKYLFQHLEKRARIVQSHLSFASAMDLSDLSKSDRIWYNFQFPGSSVEYIRTVDRDSYLNGIESPHGVIMIAHLGNHFFDESTYAKYLQWTFETLERLLVRQARKFKGDRSRAFILEASAQHFATNTGGYCPIPHNKTYKNVPGARAGKPHERRKDFMPDGPSLGLSSGCWQYPNEEIGFPFGYLCSPLAMHAEMKTSPECAETDEDWERQWTTASGWRNRIIRFEAQKHPQIGVIPMGAVTANLWDLHIGASTGSDCTHFCYGPGYAEAVAHMMATGIEAQDTKCDLKYAEYQQRLASIKENIGKEREKLQQLKSANDEKGRSKAEATIEHLQQSSRAIEGLLGLAECG